MSKAAETLDVETSCSEKDYDPQKSHVHIKMENADALQFVDSAFTITGKYVRCGHNYFCSRQ